MFKITYFKKSYIFSKYHFSKKKSHLKSPFFTNITFSKYHFSLKSHYLKHQNKVNLWRKIVILPQCDLLKPNLGQIAPLWTHNFQSLFSAEDQNQQPTLFSNSRFTRKQEKTLKKVMTVGVHWWFQDRFLPLRIFVPSTRLKLPTLWWFFPWN